MRKNLIVVALLLPTLSGLLFAVAARADSDNEQHLKEVNEWHEKRIERLQSEFGWLTLVGLMRLEEGENRFGAAADNGLVFPEKAPDYAGVFTLEDGAVRLDVNEGVEITSEGKKVVSGLLGTDADEETTVLDMDTFRFYVIERAGAYYVRVKDREAETLKNFHGIDRYPVDLDWRIEARFEPYNPPKNLQVPNALGVTFEESCPGVLVFQIDGETQRLEPVNASGGALFVVFGDETSGVETYGGGRFLYVDPPGPDSTFIVDFNKAYNPPCVFTPYATCPLPHADNVLKVPVRAGEKAYGDASH